MQQLSGMDSAFLYLDSQRTPMHIASLVIYDQSTAPNGHVGFTQLLRHYEQRLGLARCFRQRLVDVPLGLDHPYWIEDPDFDIEFHVRHIALPKPGDWRQLCIQTARLMSRPLDMQRPLWEVTVIEGLDNAEEFPPGSFAIMTKIHHAAIDGLSGAEIFAAVHDMEPDVVREIDDDWQPERAPSRIELLGRASVNNVVRPMRGIESLRRLLPDIGKVVQEARDGDLRVPSPLAPVTPFGGQVTAHRVFDGRRFALDDFKRIRKGVDGATINDVVLTIAGGALRRYLAQRDALPDEPLTALAPVSTRADDDRHSAGNEVSVMMVALATDIEDPMERLAAVHQAALDSKHFDRAIGAEALTDFVEFGPMRLATRAFRAYAAAGFLSRANPMMPTLITNVPGPQFPLYMDGAKVLGLYGLAPITDGLGLIQPVFSYDGTITMSFTGCREQLPDPANYAAAIQDSFDEMLAAN